MVKVTEADRLAAKPILEWLYGKASKPEGTSNFVAQAFAAHRIATIDECKKTVRRKMASMEWPPQDGDDQIDEVLSELDALKGE